MNKEKDKAGMKEREKRKRNQVVLDWRYQYKVLGLCVNRRNIDTWTWKQL